MLLALANALQLHHMFHNQYTKDNSSTRRGCVRTITLILDVLYLLGLLPLLLISSFIISTILLGYCACSALLLSGYLRLFSFAIVWLSAPVQFRYCLAICFSIVPTITDHLTIYQFPGAHSLSQFHPLIVACPADQAFIHLLCICIALTTPFLQDLVLQLWWPWLLPHSIHT